METQKQQQQYMEYYNKKIFKFSYLNRQQQQ